MRLTGIASRRGELSCLRPARVVARVQAVESQRTDGGDLGDVLAGSGTVEVGRAAGHDDDAAWRICRHVGGIETVDQTDVEDPDTTV